jgi:hypothetical protein
MLAHEISPTSTAEWPNTGRRQPGQPPPRLRHDRLTGRGRRLRQDHSTRTAFQYANSDSSTPSLDERT